MKAGEGSRALPALEGEHVLHYVWRLAKWLGHDVGEEPAFEQEKVVPRGRRMEPMLPDRDPGEEG